MIGRPPKDPDGRKSRYDQLSWEELIAEVGKEPRRIIIRQNGKVYAALDISYWDEVRKQGRHRRRLIGFYDDGGNLIETGTVRDERPKVVARRRTAETRSMGTDLLFMHISDTTGLTECLRKAYPKDWRAILTCSFYMLSEGKALSGCEQWSADTVTPYGKRLDDRRISELLSRLTTDSQDVFFRSWSEKADTDDNHAFDITSISSYSEEIDIVRAGYNRDHENLEQINLGLLIGSKSMIPLFYTILPGNINDRSSLNNFLKVLKARGFTGFKIVMDKGFCTKANIDLLYRMNMKFTLSLTNNLEHVKDAKEKARGALRNPDNLAHIMGSMVYRTTSLEKWTVDGKQHRCYTHVYFDRAKRESDSERFEKRLFKVKTMLDNGEQLNEHDSKFASKYFIRRAWGEKVEWRSNMEAIEEARERDHGYLVLISNHERDPDRALTIYRQKETAEQSFDDLKNTQDVDRLRVHTEGRMDGKMFIAFISLIILTRIRLTISNHEDLRHRTVPEVIREMRLLRRIDLDGRKSPLYTPRTKLQKQVVKAFGIPVTFDDTEPAGDEPEVITAECD